MESKERRLLKPVSPKALWSSSSYFAFCQTCLLAFPTDSRYAASSTASPFANLSPKWVPLHRFAIGVHPDISKKLVTMMFYLPSGSDKQQQAQAGAYGTCLHTSEQYAGRSKINGAAQCAVKFPFAPNVGYSFTVNKHSFHSASAGEFGQRRTIMCALRFCCCLVLSLLYVA